MPPSKSFQQQLITRWESMPIVNRSCLSSMFSTPQWVLELIELLSLVHHSLLSSHYEIVISYLRNRYKDVLAHLVKGQQQHEKLLKKDLYYYRIRHHSCLDGLNLLLLLPLPLLLILRPILMLTWYLKVWFPKPVHDFFLPPRIDYEGWPYCFLIPSALPPSPLLGWICKTRHLGAGQ